MSRIELSVYVPEKVRFPRQQQSSGELPGFEFPADQPRRDAINMYVHGYAAPTPTDDLIFFSGWDA